MYIKFAIYMIVLLHTVYFKQKDVQEKRWEILGQKNIFVSELWRPPEAVGKSDPYCTSASYGFETLW